MKAVVTHDHILTIGDIDRCAFTDVATGENLTGIVDVVFFELGAVEKDVTIGDFDFVARDTNDPFDKVDPLVLGGMKDDHIPSFGLVEAVAHFVRQDIFAVVEVGFHTAAVDLVGLEKEKINQGKNGQTDDNGLQEVKKK